MKIVIADSDRIYRELVSAFCTKMLGCVVLAETSSGSAAVDLICRHKPDMVLMDLLLPDSNCFSVMREVSTRFPGARFVIISAHCEEYTAHLLAKCGIHGYI